MSLTKGSWFVKLIALLAAVITYFFIHGELENIEKKEEARKNSFDPSYKLIKLTAQELPLKVRLTTQAVEGYRVLQEGVSVKPARVIVIGPEALLAEASSAETALVDVSENTKSFVKNIPLETVSGIHLSGEPYLVQVTVPIEKIEEKK